MDVEAFRETDTALGYFLAFLDKRGRTLTDATYIEDWDNMCGITLRNDWLDQDNHSMCFNFYDDGSWRCINSTSEECKQKEYEETIARKFEYMTFRDLLKFWKKHCGHHNFIIKWFLG